MSNLTDLERELLEALTRAEAAIDALEVRDLVAGWNGERFPEGQRYSPHPARLRVTLPTTAGRVYELDDAAKQARSAIAAAERKAANE